MTLNLRHARVARGRARARSSSRDARVAARAAPYRDGRVRLSPRARAAPSLSADAFDSRARVARPPLFSALVRYCRQLTDPSIIAIADNCKGLEKLNVMYASPHRRPPFPRSESHARPGTSLVRGCKQLTDPSIIAIAHNCKGLKELNVEVPQRRAPTPRSESTRVRSLSRQRNCPLLTDPEVLAIANNCKS